MRRSYFCPCVAIVILLGVATSIHADQSVKDAERLYRMARDILAPIELQTLYPAADKADADYAPDIRRACLLLEAAAALDPRNDVVWRQLYQLYMSQFLDDPGRAFNAVSYYVRLKSNDSSAIEHWVTYYMNRLQDRQAREQFLQQSMPISQQIPVLQSQILTQQGIYAIEKGLIDGPNGARSLFQSAIYRWPYNDDAAARILQLPPPDPNAIQENSDAANPPQNLSEIFEENRRFYSVLLWRVRIYNNPFDITAYVNLIETLESFGYHALTTDFYNAAYKLIENQPRYAAMEYRLRLKQCLSQYSTKDYRLALDNAQTLLRKFPNDLMVLAVAYKAAEKSGESEQAQGLLNNAYRLAAEKLANLTQNASTDELNELAWYFCFIQNDPARALELAKKASEKSPDNLRAKQLLAYAFVINHMPEMAQPLLKSADPAEPLVALSKAALQVENKDFDAARKSLDAVDQYKWALLEDQFLNLSDQVSIAQTASSAQQKNASSANEADALSASEPIKLEDLDTTPNTTDQAAGTPVQPDRVENLLKTNFNNLDLQIPFQPEKFIQCRLTLKSDIFNFNDPINAVIYLTNIGKTDIPLGPGKLIDPRIVVTATVTQVQQATVTAGAINPKNTQTFVLMQTYLLDQQLISPGRSISREQSLCTGQLQKYLDQHPLQNIQITFQLYLDPLVKQDNTFEGKIRQIQPLPVTVIRKALSSGYQTITYYSDVLKNGQAPTRISTLVAISHLLQQAPASIQGENRSLSALVDTDRFWRLIADNLSYQDFSVRAWAAYVSQYASDQNMAIIAESLQKALSDPQWFVRFMTVQSLQSVADMDEYLQWCLDTESNPVLLRQAQMLFNKPWEVQDFQMSAPPPAEK